MPSDLTTIFGKREVWRSLGTDSYSIAIRRVHRTAAIIEAQFEKARYDAGLTVDLTLTEPSFDGLAPIKSDARMSQSASMSVAVPLFETARTISEVYDRFIDDPRHTWSKRTAVAHTTTRKWVLEAFGNEAPITAITREGCREFVDLLRNMPAHADKRFPGLTIREAVAAAIATEGQRLINAANTNAYINRVGGMLNWALEEGYIDRNAMKGLKIRDTVKRRDKRNPLSDEQLSLIFNAPVFTGCRDDESGYAQRGVQRPRRARFWVPLIGLYGGLRLNEICQLEVADIAQVDGIACFRIASGVSEAGDRKSVKTAASERIVPVHTQLIRCGFLAFVESQRLSGATSLFPEVPLGHLGYRSTSFSKWFSRFLVSADAAAPLTCFHSLRHNFRDGLRAARIDRELALALGGWTTEGSGSAIADIYGSGHRAAALTEAINRVSYPALNIEHLCVVPAHHAAP